MKVGGRNAGRWPFLRQHALFDLHEPSCQIVAVAHRCEAEEAGAVGIRRDCSCYLVGSVIARGNGVGRGERWRRSGAPRQSAPGPVSLVRRPSVS